MQKFKERNTFALRKLSMGVSSIMIASGLFMLGSQDGQAAENDSNHDAQVVEVQQQDSTQQLKETNEATLPSDAYSLKDNPETSEAAIVNPSSTESAPSDQPLAASAEVDHEKTPDKDTQILETRENQNREAAPSEKGDVHTTSVQQPKLDPEFSVVDRQDKDDKAEEQAEPAAKPKLDPEFSVVDRQDKDDKAEEQAETAAKPELDPEFSVVDRQDTDKNTQKETEQKPKATEAPKQDVQSTSTDQNKKVEAPRSKATAQPTRTTSNGQTQPTTAPSLSEKAQKLGKDKFINQDPIVFVHGFSGLVGDNAPKGSNYWGGSKYKMIEELRKAGYNVFEASVSAFGSNWDRASELYAYIKGGIVDYGAAHAEKYGHERYGRTYEGILPNWQPGQRIHLVGHSMGGQTIRLLEQLLRHGDADEIAYQREHGGTMSELFQGNHDNMVTSITTIATPHDGTVASDDLGNTEVIKRILYEYNVFAGRKGQKIDYGLKQWGLEQREGETYAEYAKRVSNSPLFTSKDTALYDLTREGAKKLNARVDLNPDVYYKSYTGSATYETIFGTHIADPYMNIAHVLTGDLIGMTDDSAWRENDGLVSVISSQHPEDEAFENVDFDTPAVKGIWQVTPTLKGWDHTDFTGQDVLDWRRSGAELQKFYHDLVEDLVRKETV
ncbi:YSIRK-targeted triacylglycerol lipase [Staphylococcus intermedius]|uniref:triacylglycerol lipase n=1 Tax=Staphylococcus intermedius NCTC 11048 TaxID=1141106 RepID=A0A380G593_STAIN|nr:triacylglycerol lipase [Staphylococcus intermedius]PCF85897.1 triacylglycerol lipase [Staphylococcus intermedius]PCF89588.1 triacylglycerol lipase [Staphylococcus intermedius]PNZ51302.1 triacylglycerol lipase [Staphylococcus intermedius NCTC 11048]SUM45626.1 triacylglycerol lipase [Staphylococcus intermedius NCTC 11048]